MRMDIVNPEGAVPLERVKGKPNLIVLGLAYGLLLGLACWMVLGGLVLWLV